ncbi:hypothetical protein HYALB_00008751 [Hymenoscyphus albidus]|uniref:CorA-like transporter domain-containing protein n=1 Tax=Hymenoscyphus albidus TaxID=595503 RepID=A0A9N9LDE2_9HELO|nr:hypothetical protein HYALB_00008751 [Hymenoscyphus albidus]
MVRITTIQQYYCDDDDLYPLLADTFAPGTYTVTNLNDGGRRIEAPRRLTEQELLWLRSQKDAREERRRQQELQDYEDAYGPSGYWRIIIALGERICTASLSVMICYEKNIIKTIEGLEDCLFDAGQLDEKLSTTHPRASLLKAGKLILSRLSVTPQFNNIFTCFGYENGPGANGRGGFCEETKGEKAGHLTFETGYILKHVESKPGSEIPFSIRQLGVYQKFTVSTQKSSSLLIQPSLKVEKRIIELAKDRDIGKICAHWKNFHEIHLGTVSSNWTEYIKLIDAKVCEVEGAVCYARPNDNSPDRVTFTTLQNLKKYNDTLIRITSALELNIFVPSKLNATAIKRQSLDKTEASEQYDEFREAIQMCITEHNFLKHHVSLIQECSRELASLTIQEAQSMRTITFVAGIYLPASFTATFLSMGFLHVESLNGIMKLHATADMWFYLALTAPLMLVTMVGWWLWQFRVRQRLAKKARDIEDDVSKSA